MCLPEKTEGERSSVVHAHNRTGWTLTLECPFLGYIRFYQLFYAILNEDCQPVTVSLSIAYVAVITHSLIKLKHIKLLTGTFNLEDTMCMVTTKEDM